MTKRGDFDVIVVGARAAGAATALLLARAGLRVLAVDRARFPSDTLSTHQVQLPGVALLRQWGILDRLVAAKVPAARTVKFDAGSAVIRGAYPSFDGADGVYSPRRTLLDTLLVAAAREAGATVEEGFMVEGLVDGGVRGRPKRGREQTLRSSLVIGADGKHSAIARQVGARTYRARAASSAACYAYFEGLPLDGGEVYSRPDRLVTLWPTNDGLTVVYLGVPAAAFPRLRADLTGGYRAAVEAVGDLRERLHAARMVEHVRATSDLPARFRRPYGKGWALAGDAGLVMDPITGQGIGNALRDADALSRAVVAGGEHFAGYHRQRDAERRPMYALTARVAAFRPGRGGDRLLRAIADDPDQSSRFLGVLTGAVPVKDLLGPAAVLKFLAQRAGSSMRA